MFQSSVGLVWLSVPWSVFFVGISCTLYNPRGVVHHSEPKTLPSFFVYCTCLYGMPLQTSRAWSFNSTFIVVTSTLTSVVLWNIDPCSLRLNLYFDLAYFSFRSPNLNQRPEDFSSILFILYIWDKLEISKPVPAVFCFISVFRIFGECSEGKPLIFSRLVS